MPPRTPRAPQSPAPSPGGGLAPDAPQGPESYTNRLLKAKQRVWEDRDKDKDKDKEKDKDKDQGKKDTT
jgi:hypothetical protein